MTEATPETTEGGIDPRVILASIMGGPKGVHEIGVNGSVIEQTIELLDSHMKPSFFDIEAPDGTAAPGLIGRDGLTFIDDAEFDQYRDAPRRRKGRATLLDLASFIEHTNRFKDGDSLVFANNDRRSPTMTAVLNYHRAGSDADPRFGDHRGFFAFPLSDEWKAWSGVDGEAMKMRDFAAFLEDRIIDVLPVTQVGFNDEQQRFVDALGGNRRIADPAKLMELSTGLQVFENSEVSSAVKLASGEASMTFTSQHVDAGGGQLNVPSMFVIAIPVFTNGPAYQVVVRLRYRKVGADLLFFTEMWRTDRVFDHAVDEAVEKVKADTGLPVLLGSPE